MKIKLLIAAEDNDYIEHLSNVLSGKHADAFDVSVCSSVTRIKDAISSNRYDAILLEPSFTTMIGKNAAPLLLILWDGIQALSDSSLKYIRKYQRISSIASSVLEGCAAIDSIVGGFDANRAKLTAVWSPAGGVGKTSTALAYCTRKVAEGKQLLYLNLEHFSSVPIYFSHEGKSISTVFDKLEINAGMLLRSIRQQDSGSGIMYFCGPNNYDDINVLTVDDIAALVGACAAGVDELVIDLPSVCEAKTQRIFEMADAVFLVCDSSKTSQLKIEQFVKQHNVAQKIADKTVLVSNKGAKHNGGYTSRTVELPYVQSSDAIVVYKTLSGHSFER